MTEKEFRPPRWGPIPDPAPWGPPWVDPIPWWWRHVPFPHPGDPIWLSKFIDQIKPEVMVELQRLEIEAARVHLDAQLEFTRSQARARLDLMEQQLDVLKKSIPSTRKTT